jgi:hypothetical protein
VIFASELTPPNGFNGFLESVMYGAVVIAAISTVIKQWGPTPPLGEQFEALKLWVGQFFASKTRLQALDARVTELKENKLKRFEATDKAIADLRTEMQRGFEKVQESGEARMEKLGEKIDEIGINNANGIGELRGEIRRIK